MTITKLIAHDFYPGLSIARVQYKWFFYDVPDRIFAGASVSDNQIGDKKARSANESQANYAQ